MRPVALAWRCNVNDRPKADVIEKLRKILKRTEEAGCTEAESQAAMEMASRLMAEHNLSMGEIEKEDSATEAWLTESAHESSKWTKECNVAYFVVKEFFFVEGIITTTSGYGSNSRKKTTKTLRFFGKASNVEAGKWAFKALLDAFDRLFADYRKLTKCPATDRRAFTVGVAQGFAHKMREERKVLEVERDREHGSASGCTALAIVSIAKETNQEFQKAYGKLRKGSSNFADVRDSGGALAAGYKAGRTLKPLPATTAGEAA